MNLKPCPFCGNSEEVGFTTFDYQESCRQDTEKAAIQCESCGAMGGVEHVNISYKNGSNVTDYESIKKTCAESWNRRNTTNELVTLYEKAYEYAASKFGNGKKPNIIDILEDGKIMATWRTYLGCDDWETKYEHFTPEEIN